MSALQPGGNGSQGDSVNPLADVSTFGYDFAHEAPESGNELGYKGMPSEYGQNDAGPWSEALGDDLYGAEVDDTQSTWDAQKHQWADFNLVEGNLAGDAGPLGGSTPAENPLA